jgi:hypothetical protein
VSPILRLSRVKIGVSSFLPAWRPLRNTMTRVKQRQPFFGRSPASARRLSGGAAGIVRGKHYNMLPDRA